MRWKEISIIVAVIATVTAQVTVQNTENPEESTIERVDETEEENENGDTATVVTDSTTMVTDSATTVTDSLITATEGQTTATDGETTPTNAETTTPTDSQSTIVTTETITTTTVPETLEILSAESAELIIPNLVIHTTHGPVQGFRWKGSDNINSFIDIPYGRFEEPFQAPISADIWPENDIHNVAEHTSFCPQFLNNGSYIGDQNCLTLSIFTPNEADNASVLIHIHDDGLDVKSANPAIYGPEYLVPEGVILVLPNYRVGPLGFLCLQNATAPGNAGLKDLSLALDWIKENIEAFGGNPNNIAVSGDGGAGAVAAHLALYGETRQHISKVITESGSALSHLALDRDPTSSADELAAIIRTDYSNDIVYNNLFEEAPLATILEAASGMRFAPCVEHGDNVFIDDTPWNKISNEDIDITFMIGCATYAGAREALDISDTTISAMNTDFSTQIPGDLVFSDDERGSVSHDLKTQYFGDEDITNENIEELALWYTDTAYLGPSLRLARRLVAFGAHVYFYEFAFHGARNMELESMNRPVAGAVRGDMRGYLFKQEDSPTAEPEEQQVIDTMVNLWTSFINNGTPLISDEVVWERLVETAESQEQLLHIGSAPSAAEGVHVARLRAWTALYDAHFVDNSSAGPPKPCYPLALLAAWLVNAKLN